MKVLVMMMWADIQPSIRNLSAFEDSVVKPYLDKKDDYENEFFFCAYYSTKDDERSVWLNPEKGRFIDVYGVNEDEGIFRTYEKTYKMFEYACENIDFDLLVRINISMWINLRVLDKVCSQFDKEKVYCNAINTHINGNSEYANDLYPRGDMFIMSRETLEGIVKVGRKYLYEDTNLMKRIGVDHIDDCLMGVCLIDLYGKDYFKHIVAMKYNFCPDNDVDFERFNGFAIGTRLKTTPPNTYSGYSWNDNEYRLRDSFKFEQLGKWYSQRYDALKGVELGLKDLMVNQNESRPTIFIQGVSKRIDDEILTYLCNKR